MIQPAELVRFREGAREQRIVLLPGLGADVSQMRLIADGLGGAGVVDILDLTGMAATGEGVLTVETLANQCYALVTAAGGADAFVGYSLGGLVAVEMARLAQAEGKNPALVLIDAAPESAHWPLRVWLTSIGLLITAYGGALLELPLKDALAELGRRTTGLIGRIRRRRNPSSGLKFADPVPGAAGRLTHAYRVYKPAPLSSRMTLIECSDPAFVTPPSMVWRTLVSELEVLRYDGGHLDAFRSPKCASAIARHLNACLGLTQNAAGAS